MKKLICLIFVLVLIPSTVFSETLSLNEQNYLGSWSMCATNSKGTTYVFVITFFDNMEVVQKSMTFEKGKLVTDNKASGIWGGFTDKTILFTLAGTDMSAMIKENGYLYLYFFKEMSLCGIYSKCEDMTSVLGW